MSVNPDAKIERLEEENKELRKEIFNFKKKLAGKTLSNNSSDFNEDAYKFLKQSEYASIFEQVPVGVMLYDSDLKIIDINRTFREIFGLKTKDIIGFDLTKLKEQRILPAIKQVLEMRNGYYEGEYIPTVSNSGVKQIVLRTLPHQFVYKEGILQGGIAVFEDITDKKMAEEAINKTFDVFQTVTDNINAHIYVVNPETRKILFMNRNARNIFGAKYKVLCEENIEKTGYAHLKNLNCVLNDNIVENLQDIKVYETESFNEQLNRWFHYSYRLIDWIDGSKALFVSSTDIQEQKETLEQIKSQNEEIKKQREILREESKMKDTMFSIIGHDLRGPIGNIKGALDILIDDYADLTKEDIKDFINTVRDSAGSAYNLLANLLNWAKNRSEKINFMPEKIDINEIIEENLILFKANSENKSIEITYDNSYAGQICGDENMINTIIRNLISNAVKFTPNGGYIAIGTEQVEIDGIKYLQIEVCDTGIGISKEKQEKLFTSKSPYSTYGTNNEKGSGLGLILCHAFVKKHHGKIDIQSTEGTGTCFNVLLPEKYVN